MAIETVGKFCSMALRRKNETNVTCLYILEGRSNVTRVKHAPDDKAEYADLFLLNYASEVSL